MCKFSQLYLKLDNRSCQIVYEYINSTYKVAGFGEKLLFLIPDALMPSIPSLMPGKLVESAFSAFIQARYISIV